MADSDDTPRIYSEVEAAAKLGMTVRMLASRRRAGKIGHIKDGKFIGYYQKHLDAYCGIHDTDYSEYDIEETKPTPVGLRVRGSNSKTPKMTLRRRGVRKKPEGINRREIEPLKRHSKDAVRDPMRSPIFGFQRQSAEGSDCAEGGLKTDQAPSEPSDDGPSNE